MRNQCRMILEQGDILGGNIYVNQWFGKAIWPNELEGEVLKTLLKDEDMQTTITKFFNTIYDNGVLPQDWLRSTFVTLPKKPNSSDCNDYKTISLMFRIIFLLKIVPLLTYML